MSTSTIQIFVSSTWLDLQPERKAVETAIQRMHETKFVGMEYFGSRDETTRRASLDEVDRSEIYLGIIGGRYGSGITEDEYRRARERGLPCFIYFKREADITAEQREQDPEKATRLAALKEELRRTHIITPEFTSPDDLAAKVTADLHRWLFDEYLKPKLEAAAMESTPRPEIEALLAAIKESNALSADLMARLRKTGYTVAEGQGSIAVRGDVKDSLLVTGSGTVININHPPPPAADSSPETPPRDYPAPSLPADPAPLPRATGSPFVVGRPLRANEPIFGREEAFRFIAGELARFSSVNIIGERRMGKTSLLNHLLAHQSKYIITQPDHPPLVLARVDLQDNVSNASRFYGTALRELLAHLTLRQIDRAGDLAALRARLSREPAATYDEFQSVLRQFRDRDGLGVCPLIVVDEFERLLEASAAEGFPYPDFFNGIRALMTIDLLAMVIASSRPLAEYFSDPARPDGLTSTFPTYFQPFRLKLLGDTAADGLLLQPSNHSLTLHEVAEARRWAGGRPCHLQAAGAAWYQAKDGDHPPKWARSRFNELVNSVCLANMLAATKQSRRSPKRGRE